MKFAVEKELTDEELEDIFTTALESGSEGIGYWACLRNDDESWESSERSVIAAGKHPYWSTVMLHVLQSGESVRFQDAEDTEDGDIWEYNMDSLRQSCIKYEQQRGSIKMRRLHLEVEWLVLPPTFTQLLITIFTLMNFKNIHYQLIVVYLQNMTLVIFIRLLLIIINLTCISMKHLTI